MNDLESFNKLEKLNYYDKEDWEEDEPYDKIPLEIHKEYEEKEEIFNKICQDVHVEKGIENSLKEREINKINSNDFIYGEITFRTLSYLINHINFKYEQKLRKGIFLDLGSGTGRAIVAAALCFPFQKCIGVELLTNLHCLAKKLNENLNDYDSELLCKKNNIYFINDDFTGLDIDELNINNNTSLIFINCKTFTKSLMMNIAEKYSQVTKGSYLITSFQNMEEFDPKWKNIEKLRKVMSWGPATLYINYKIE